MPYEIELEDLRIGFASAHFIVGHDKCGRMHGHNYFLKVTLTGELNDQQMVLDYGLLKEELQKLTKPLDHKVLLATKAEGLFFEETDETVTVKTCGKRYVIPREDVFFLPIAATTAEELARYFHQELKKIWPNFGIRTTIEEAPGTSATYYE